MERNGKGQDEMGGEGKGKDGTRRNGMGREWVGWDQT